MPRSSCCPAHAHSPTACACAFTRAPPRSSAGCRWWRRPRRSNQGRAAAPACGSGGQRAPARRVVPGPRGVDAEIELLPGTRALTHGMRVRVHQGTAEVLGRVSLVAPATAIEPGARGGARLRLEGPAVLTRGDRFV